MVTFWSRLNLIIIVVHRQLQTPENYDPAFNFEYRGPVTMKGRATPMEVYFLTRNSEEQQSLPIASATMDPAAMPTVTINSVDIPITPVGISKGIHEAHNHKESSQERTSDSSVIDVDMDSSTLTRADAAKTQA